MQVTVPIYQARSDSLYIWTSVGLGPHTVSKSAPSPFKVQSMLTDELRRKIADLLPGEMLWFQLKRGTRLERVRLELSLRGGGKRRKVSGSFPLIIEPRWASDEQRMLIAYHPSRQHEWFPLREGEPLDAQAELFFSKAWASEPDELITALTSNGKDLLKVVSLTGRPKMLLDQLPEKKKGLWDDLKVDPSKKGAKKERDDRGYKLLHKLGVNLTTRALDGGLRPGLPRSPLREQLQLLLCGQRKQPTVVVGKPGAGKSVALAQWVHDLIAADDYASHRNRDRLHDVWQLSGKRIIAGMSYVGDWEQRCIDLLDDARRKRLVVVAEDLHLWGQIGRSRDSDRALADMFRGPLSRGEILLVGECTDEQLRRLEDDAPSFASLFTRVHVGEATKAETFRMLVHETRALEDGGDLEVSPFALRTLIEMASTLFTHHAFPGKAIDLLRQLARARRAESRVDVTPASVVGFLSKKTGLPELLLRPEQVLDAEALEASFARQVLGQREAVSAACDLVLRIKAGLCDPGRPYGVYLFTGPTGTGKTELAKCLAEYLYGTQGRLLRFDMSEYGTHDAPARLIGDRFDPEGQLTRRVQEQPFCVVLFDEIEKAHPDVLNLLLQLFDEGRLTDASGATASFTHAVVIMTSNLGARASAPVGFGDQGEAVVHDAMRAVRDFFPPELFNRIDRVVSFRPLGRDVATAVAHKELSRLLSRRGLSERNIFVHVGEGVADRVASRAFAQEDGARSLKRFLESEVVSTLSSHIAEGPRAAMQVVRLLDVAGTLQIEVEPLTEAEPYQASYALEPLLPLSATALASHLLPAAGFLQELEQSRELATLSDKLRQHLREHNLGRHELADQIYNLEAVRLSISQFRERVDELCATLRGDRDREIDALTQFAYVADHDTGESFRTRLFDRRSVAASRRPEKSEMLACLAEVEFLRRALSAVDDPSRHAVLIELLRTGDAARASRFGGASPGLLTWLTTAYAEARGEVEEMAVRGASGEVTVLRGAEVREMCSKLHERDPVQVVIKVFGLCVLDFFEHETGSHVFQPLAELPEIVRVRVSAAAPGVGASAVIEGYLEAKKRHEAAIARGGKSEGPSPDKLLPVVRKVRFEPPRGAQAVPIEVEDYVLGHSDTTHARSLQEALSTLWLLRMSARPLGAA